MKVTRYSYSGAAAIDFDIVPSEGVWVLNSIMVHLSAAATTGSQDLAFTLEPEEGAAFNTVFESTEMVADGGTDVVYLPNPGVVKIFGRGKNAKGDNLNISFPNTDTLTVGVLVTMTLDEGRD